MQSERSMASLRDNRLAKTLVRSLAMVFALSWLLGGITISGGGCTIKTIRASLAATAPSFDDWLAELRQETVAAGIISPSLFDRVFAEITPIERIIALDRKQPEFSQSFAEYYLLRVTDARVDEGRTLLEKHRPLLQEVERRYGVPPEVLVALWGMETAYGRHFGAYNTIAALATLAFDERRSAFFRKELLIALSLLEEGALRPEEYYGSWAGAVGHMQFMPSTYRTWAVDGDGDGQRNLYASLPDAFHSAGSFLSGIGWKRNEPWGEEVQLASNFDGFALSSGRTPPETRRPRSAWKTLGVRRADGSPLPDDALSAALLLPAGANGPAFLVYRNYNRILNWNRSRLYALSVGSLADRLSGANPPSRPLVREARLRIDDIRAVQSALADLGFYNKNVDGVLGSGTRSAIAAFQRSLGLPPDGHLNHTLLQKILATKQP